MIWGLEHMSYEGKLREPSVFSLTSRRLRRNLLMEELEKAIRLIWTHTVMGRKATTQLQKGKFWLDIRTFFSP